MSTVNKPILLDATGQEIVNQLRLQNGYLSVLAGGRREEVYSSMSQIASIVRSNGVDENKKLFPIGDQIIMPWKDMDDPAHNTDETAYQVQWDIVHHGLVTLQTGEVVPGMFLQMHKCSAYGVQFSHQQAFYACPDGLAAGTYYVTFGSSWGSKGANAGTSWNFTLTQDVPAGGLLSGFESLPDVATSSFSVKSLASATAESPIETVAVSSGAAGTDLGTMQYTTTSDGSPNCMQKVSYGSNRWGTCAVRQYLNAKGLNWFAPKEKFDIRPDQFNKYGFMSGFDDDFLSAIKPVKVTTALNTVEGFDKTTEDTFDIFFLPSLEQMNVVPQLANVEGPYFEYWRQRGGVDHLLAQYGTYPEYKTPAINSTSPQYVRLRSASRGHAFNTWDVNASGYVYYYYYASHAHRFSPVCVIC